ncbi:MAG: ABC transporter ATP-binding protein [Oceanipulchritudo sp.]
MLPRPFVRFDALQKRYGKGPLVLDSLDLSVREGEFVSLIGPSGCGKSTLLKLLAGLSPVSAGDLVIDGMKPVDAREEMFYVFQEANLLPWSRVLENVELPLRIRGDARDRRRERAREMVELVGLKEAERQFPWQLSGGMRMRVSIARALSVRPKILLLDEPFGALDEMTRDGLNEDLLEIRERDPFTAFFVTHSVAEAVFLSTRIVVLSANPGRIADVIEVPFAFPRKAELRESPEYLEVLAVATRALRDVISES